MTNEAYPGSSYPAMPGEPVRDLAPLGPPPGLGVLAGLAAFVQPAAGLSRALGVVALVIDVAIIVMLAQRPSSQFFRRTR